MKDEVYSVEEVAAKMDVHSRTVRRYIAAGELSASRDGKKWFVKKEDLTGFINNRNPLSRNDHQHQVKEDDLCVFLDSGYHKSECRVQICTVVDIKAASSEEVQPLLDKLNAAFSVEKHDHCIETKMQSVYKTRGKKMRIVIWASPQSIALAMDIVGAFVTACE